MEVKVQKTNIFYRLQVCLSKKTATTPLVQDCISFARVVVVGLN